mgnify:CR=1 FL=1
MTESCCRFCQSPLTTTFVDLGMSPLSNAYIAEGELRSGETFYPLHTFVCAHCFLVQLEEFETPDKIFSEYAYFSSYSETWLNHAKRYVDSMVTRFGLSCQHQVVEVASNDGYLLQYFHEKGVPVLGVEPAVNVAKVAQDKGIASVVRFFNEETARELAGQGKQADLLLGNNVLAHVPDINDFVRGMALLLKANGVITMEFPHLLQLIEHNQFDTIYHEHFSYLSLLTVQQIFAEHGLRIFDVEQLPTHGGSLRIYACHVYNDDYPQSHRVADLQNAEVGGGLDRLETYQVFSQRVYRAKRELLKFFIAAQEAGKSVVGYGAAAKGNTLLNYCGIKADFMEYVVDRSPHKQGRYLPGTHIPIYEPEQVAKTKPDYLVVLPWNIKEEVVEQMTHIREWGGRFVVPIPTVEVFD